MLEEISTADLANEIINRGIATNDVAFVIYVEPDTGRTIFGRCGNMYGLMGRLIHITDKLRHELFETEEEPLED